MNSIEIDGMVLEDLPLKDAVDMTRELLERPGLDLIICTTESSFFRTDISEEKKNWLESASLNVFDVAGTDGGSFFGFFRQHNRNMKAEDYLAFLLGYLQGTGRNVTLITEDPEKADRIKRNITREYEDIDIEICALSEYGTGDSMYNALNGSEPEAIIAVLPWKVQTGIIRDAGNIFMASLWVALPEESFKDKRLV